MTRREVQVELAGRSYPVAVEMAPVEALGVALRRRLAPGRLLVIADQRVARLHWESVARGLEEAGFTWRLWTVPGAESSKRLSRVGRLCAQLVAEGAERSDTLLALGGGVVSDLAGFVAATLLRGLPWAAAPTTLLAQVDAAIGGKTGVNLSAGKNLVGCFHQPRIVVSHLPVLSTLPVRELRSGLAEVVKYGAVAAPELLEAVAEHGGELLSAEPEALLPVVATCAGVKARLVSRDERDEDGTRAVLNFGHTLGHALEMRYGGRRLRHGEAVSLGMVAATVASERMGVAEPGLAALLGRVLGDLGLPVEYQALLDDDVWMRIGCDKKRAQGRIRFVALAAPGRTTLVDLRADELAALLRPWT